MGATCMRLQVLGGNFMLLSGNAWLDYFTNHEEIKRNLGVLWKKWHVCTNLDLPGAKQACFHGVNLQKVTSISYSLL